MLLQVQTEITCLLGILKYNIHNQTYKCTRMIKDLTKVCEETKERIMIKVMMKRNEND